MLHIAQSESFSTDLVWTSQVGDWLWFATEEDSQGRIVFLRWDNSSTDITGHFSCGGYTFDLPPGANQELEVPSVYGLTSDMQQTISHD